MIVGEEQSLYKSWMILLLLLLIIIIIIIQFNSILYFLCAGSTATMPITDTAQHRNIIIIKIIIIKYNNSP
jgi:hypothetical protein